MDPIEQLAAKMEPALRQAFLKAVRTAVDQISINDLKDAIETGDYSVLQLIDVENRFTAILQGQGVAADAASFREVLRTVYAAAAKQAAKELPARISTPLSFDLLNPQSVSFLQHYEMKLIREISSTTREGIERVVMRAFIEGGHPLTQAREIKQTIGLTARQEQAVANYRKALESGADSELKSALSRALRDGRFDRTITRSLRTGSKLKQDQIDAMVQRYRERYLQYRARMIARTETLRASNIGQQMLWKQGVAQGHISSHAKRQWVASGDKATCPLCRSLNGKVVGIDEEFAPGIMNPPDTHPDCRCGQSLVASTIQRKAA